MLKLLKRATLVAVLLLPAAGLAAEQAQPPAKLDEAALIAVLKSEASQFEKAEACRLLQRCGTKQAVPALAALLGDEKLNHMARYALEPLPDPSVDEALRDALGKLKGRPLVGVIISLGVRRDAKAAEPLVKLLGDADADVARGAAQALGSIGTAEAATALDAAVAKAPAANQVALCEGLLRAAEALAAAGKKDLALGAYDILAALKPGPQQVRAGALRGGLLLRGDDGLPLLLEAIRGSDYVLVAAAARAAMEMTGDAVTKALCDELGKLPVDKQVLLTLTIGKRGDAAAVPALVALAKRGDKTARVAAIRALPEIGSGTATQGLLELMADPEADVAAAARDALTSLSSPEVDAALSGMLAKGDAKTRAAAIEMLGQRRVVGATPALLKAAEDPDETIRLACIKVLGESAGVDEFPALVGLLLKAKSPAELKAAEGALAGVCMRQAQPATGKVVIIKAVYGALPDGPSADVTKKVAELVKGGALSVEASNGNFGDPANGIGKKLQVEYSVEGATENKTVSEGDSVMFTGRVTPPALVDALCSAMAQAPAEPKLALLRVLRSAGGKKALDAVRAAANDANAQIKDTAISALCDWPSPDALPDVTQLAKTGTTQKVKILALRGYIRLLPMEQVPVEKKLASLKEAISLIERDEERRLVLAALAVIPTADALQMVAPYLTNEALKEEAAIAAVAIAEKVVGGNPALVAEVMAKVTQETRNKQTARKAKSLLDQAKKSIRQK